MACQVSRLISSRESVAKASFGAKATECITWPRLSPVRDLLPMCHRPRELQRGFGGITMSGWFSPCPVDRRSAAPAPLTAATYSSMSALNAGCVLTQPTREGVERGG